MRVRNLEPDQVFEVDTPNLAFSLRQPGEYRIEVDPDGSATSIFVRKGQGEAYGDGASYVIDSRQPYRFTGTQLRDYQQVAAPRFDEFDRWAGDRDRRYDASVSARYVSPEVIGAMDLDAHGSWRVDASYGHVWVPSGVPAGWAPYRYGHWAWIVPWGWTWVDDAPWGFAVSHYGRWANMQGIWGWVPGPMRMPAVYAPALVVFIGGGNFQLALSSGPVGGVAWFPLAPREVYRPAYPVSRGYYEQVNRSNTVINNTVIQKTYNTTNVTNIVYANRKVPGAVVAVPTAAFVQAQPVSRAAMQVSGDTLQRAPLANMAALAPTEQSVRGAAARGDKPPTRVFERPVIAHTAPPAPRTVATALQPAPASVSGKAGDDAQRPGPKPAAAGTTRAVRVVEQPQATPPTRRPPPLQASAGSTEASDGTKRRQAAESSASRPAAAPLAAAPTRLAAQPSRPAPLATPVEPAAPSARPVEPRARTESPDKAERRAPAAAPAADLAPKVAAPAGRPPAARGQPDAQVKAAQSQPQMPAPAPVPAVKPVVVSAPQLAAAVPAATQRAQPANPGPPRAVAATPPEAAQPVQRGKPEPLQAGRQAPAHAPGAASIAPPTAPQETAGAQSPAPEPASGKAKDKGNGADESKRDEAERKPKN